jgi:hypothetical protein
MIGGDIELIGIPHAGRRRCYGLRNAIDTMVGASLRYCETYLEVPAAQGERWF